MRPTIMMLIAGICWSFSGILIKEIHWNAFAIAGCRSLIGGMMQFAFLIYIAKSESNATFQSALSGIIKRVYLSKDKAQWLGASLDVVNMMCLVWAFQLAKAANAVFLHYGGFVLVALFSAPILRQKLGSRDWTSLLIALAGIALLTSDGFQHQSTIGTLLGVACCLSFAVAQTCMGLRAKSTSSKFGAMETILLANTLSFLLSLPVLGSGIGLPPTHEWFYLILLGILPWGLPDILYTIAIKHVPIFRALILGLSDPILSAVWPMLILNEIPSAMAIAGAFLVASGMIFQSVPMTAFQRIRLATNQVT